MTRLYILRNTDLCWVYHWDVKFELSSSCDGRFYAFDSNSNEATSFNDFKEVNKVIKWLIEKYGNETYTVIPRETYGYR